MAPSPIMLMLAAMVAGAERSSSDLGTSATELTAATERVIGVSTSGFWNAMPQAPQEITVEKGTKLVFKWNGGHDLVIATKDVFDSCVCTGSRTMRHTHLAPHYSSTRGVLNVIRASRPAPSSAWPLSPRRLGLVPVTRAPKRPKVVL